MTQSGLFDHIGSPVARLAAHILERLDSFDGTITKRELQRRLNAHKYPLWKRAWELLISYRCIEVTPLGARRQAVVKWRETPKWLQAGSPVKKRKRKRRQTPWFKGRLSDFLRRDGYDDRADQIEQQRG